jgi:hypothetical protein
MGNARAKTTPKQVIEISGEEVASVIQATDVARMRAFQDFLSEDETDDRRRAGKQRGRMPRKLRTKPWKVTSCLPGVSDFLLVRLTCEGPASATVCAGSA